MEEGKELNERQAAFVREYLVDFNATQAAIRAGYSEKTAGSQGERLLRNAEIQKAIDAGKASVCKRNEVTVDRIVQELERIAFGDLKNSVKWDGNKTVICASDELSPDVSATIASIEEDERDTPHGTHRKVKVKHWDKLRALELLARYKGMLVDRKEISGKGGGPVQVEQKSWLDVVGEAVKK